MPGMLFILVSFWCIQVTLWKENLEGNWISLSEITRGRQTANTYANEAAGGSGINGTFTRDSLAPAPTSNYYDAVAP
ncbi:unnamed protein product [Dibothriocephalus latus]|uniref:Uncharacterized protein n=1 Tax=Dibothriocephalus latus TaxID=60516 RepID=A0A3P7R5U1_DIBLA|nr:unnamed protein product [Dibothriocephalus latus]